MRVYGWSWSRPGWEIYLIDWWFSRGMIAKRYKLEIALSNVDGERSNNDE